MNTVCPKIGDQQWTCAKEECTCHLRPIITAERIRTVDINRRPALAKLIQEEKELG